VWPCPPACWRGRHAALLMHLGPGATGPCAEYDIAQLAASPRLSGVRQNGPNPSVKQTSPAQYSGIMGSGRAMARHENAFVSPAPGFSTGSCA